MGKNSRARRDARRQAHQRTPRVTPHPTDQEPVGEIDQASIVALIDRAARYAVDAPRSIGPHLELLNELGVMAPSPAFDPAALVVDEVMTRIASAFEHGWQPLDLVHAARRQTTKQAATWLTRAVQAEAEQSQALLRAPREWSDQLDVLSSRRRHSTGRDALLPGGGQASSEQWIAALVVVDFLHRIPRLEHLLPPPSRWGTEVPRRPATGTSAPLSGDRAKTLTKIRALLAKAESTDFAAEAEAFTSKAQDLMTRHSIDETLLAADAGATFDVRGLRVLIDQPYAMEKASLLHVVAEANRVRAVWNDFAAYVTLVGLPTDVEQVDMLFTSTLVQATRAMTQADLSTAPFRRAFLQAFALRISERLTASTEETVASYGSSLVPVLERQAEAIAEEFERLFPHVTAGARRRRQFDVRGWEAGTRAADAAVLPAGVVES